jgi:Family of unknown function (DUF6941)
VRVTFMLCDAAQEMGGKLYILGGGWSMLHTPNQPFSMALAIQVAIPWDQTNRPIEINAKLFSEDGEAVEIEGNPIEARAQAEVGRPPGLKPGTDLDLALAPSFAGLVLPPGGFRWELFVDDEQVAVAPFRIAGG